MKTINLFIIFSFLGILISCSNQTKEVLPEEKTKVIEEKVDVSTLPVLSKEVLTRLFAEANGFEGTFYHSGKSVSLWDDNVKGVMAMMIEPPKVELKSDKLIGHVIILKKDELSADMIAYIEVYVSGANSYIVFKVDNQKYFHSLNEKGLEFYTKMATPASPQH